MGLTVWLFSFAISYIVSVWTNAQSTERKLTVEWDRAWCNIFYMWKGSSAQQINSTVRSHYGTIYFSNYTHKWYPIARSLYAICVVPLRFMQCLLNPCPMDKMATISQTTFSNIFSWMIFFYFDWNSTEVCSQGSKWQYISIGSGNGLAPNRRQAINLNQCRPSSLMHICSTRERWIRHVHVITKPNCTYETGKHTYFKVGILTNDNKWQVPTLKRTHNEIKTWVQRWKLRSLLNVIVTFLTYHVRCSIR